MCGGLQFDQNTLEANPLMDPNKGLGYTANSPVIAADQSITKQTAVKDDQVFAVGDQLTGQPYGGTITNIEHNDPSGYNIITYTMNPEERIKQAKDNYNFYVGLANTTEWSEKGDNIYASLANRSADFLNSPIAQDIQAKAAAPDPEAPALINNTVDSQIKQASGIKPRVKRPPATILNSLSSTGKNLTGQ